MGYRSEVALTMKKEDVLELLKQAMAQSDNGSAQNFLCYDKILDHQNGYASLYWDWVKWYEDYPEIAFVTQFYNDIVEKGNDVSFKRIGEDNNDYESAWSGDWDVDECVELVRKLDYEINSETTEEVFMQTE
jgi:hypothetical protein